MLADDSHVISYLIFLSKIGKNVTKFVTCCSCDWRFRVNMFIDGQYPFSVYFSMKTYIVSANWKCLIPSHEHLNKKKIRKYCHFSIEKASY